MAGATSSGRKPMGIELDLTSLDRADRLKTVLSGTRAAVLRAAIELGLTELERRHPEATPQEQVA